ncbi:MAG: hypothetical protein M3N17_08025 [Actinomycetota bacterium]|nr:hypothetical protein [Actinomycetota bacterium]
MPTFRFPETAAGTLGHATRYGLWRTHPLGHVVRVTDADPRAAREVVDEALPDRAGDAWLDACGPSACCAPTASPPRTPGSSGTPDRRRWPSVSSADRWPSRHAAPVRKSELGGVRLGLGSPEEAVAAARAVLDELRRHGME